MEASHEDSQMRITSLVRPNARATPRSGAHIDLVIASGADRDEIYRIRHDVYACEIGQHPANAEQRLNDGLDESNIYIAAKIGDSVAAFVSVTPPASGRYSIDRYFSRHQLPFAMDDCCHEVRLLTVCQKHRGTKLAALLMYAAFRWVEAHGGTRIIAIGRDEILSVYLRSGLVDCQLTVQSGAVRYHLLTGDVADLRQRVDQDGEWVDHLQSRVRWQLGIPMKKPASCFHGGAFFDAIGPGFTNLSQIDNIINADVLDAWFPPAPEALTALQTHLPWLLRTSPPTDCGGLIRGIASARGLRPENILAGAGSSDLIFRALPHWLEPSARVLLLDPTYGEYAHVLEKVIGCRVERLRLRREQNYAVSLDALEVALQEPYALVVLVNPNSPTGQHVKAEHLLQVLAKACPATRIWIDETYIDFVDTAESLERFAANSPNVIVCKSMSKAYALSGARVAYLCASPHHLEELRALTPPWAVSLTAQVAAVRALEAQDYYQAHWHETRTLSENLARSLREIGWNVLPGVANFLLCHLPENGRTAAEVVRDSRAHGLFLRDAKHMGMHMGDHAIRVAVKDAATQQRMICILREATRHNAP